MASRQCHALARGQLTDRFAHLTLLVYVLPWTVLQSGAVDTADLLALLAAYGRGCAALVQPADVATVQRGETLGAGTTYMIPMSDPLELLTVVKSSNVSEWPVPCARSYDGNGWEVVQPRAGRPGPCLAAPKDRRS